MMELLRRIWYLLNRRRFERDLADEMAYHRELTAAGGFDNFGSALRLREDAREIWGWTWLDRLWQDLAYGWRVLRNSPGFTLTAMLILAVGIGMTLTAFRLALREFTPSAPHPETLVRVEPYFPGGHSSTIAWPALQFFAAHARSFRTVVAETSASAIFGEANERVGIEFVTANYFTEMGGRALRGRLLVPAIDEAPGADAVALLNQHFWERRLGGEASAIGQTVRVNGMAVKVIGILEGDANPAIWMPLAQQPYVVQGSTLLQDWNGSVTAYARLAPGVSRGAAEEETRALAAQLREQRPGDIWKDERLRATPLSRPDMEHLAEALMIGTLFLLILAAACANLGTLLLARGATREREIRTRMALGADRRRVIRQLLTESLLLGCLSGAAALALSTVGLRIAQALSDRPEDWASPTGWPVFAATLAISLLASAVFGLPPAMRMTSTEPHRGRARAIFLAAQVAASCLLLMLSGLLARSLQRLVAMDPGFDYERAVVLDPGLGAHGYKGAAADVFMDQLSGRLLALPGVERISTAMLAPWGNQFSNSRHGGVVIWINHVDPEFRQTLGLRLTQGRDFARGERGVAIVSESLARWQWPGENPIGKTLSVGELGVVVGVVRAAGTFNLRTQDAVGVYYPLQVGEASVAVARVKGRPEDYLASMANAAKALDARLRPEAHTLQPLYRNAIAENRQIAAAMGVLGGLATLLSAIGLAGLAGYIVVQRTREIGVRMALGANRRQVIRAVVAPMLRPLIAGFAIGALGAAGLSQPLRRQIFGLLPFDPVAYAGSIALFTAVMALAALAPARRAMRVNPSDALRHE
jgi:predicted permease